MLIELTMILMTVRTWKVTDTFTNIIVYVFNSRMSLPAGQLAQIARLVLLNYCLKEKQIFMKINIFFFLNILGGCAG